VYFWSFACKGLSLFVVLRLIWPIDLIYDVLVIDFHCVFELLGLVGFFCVDGCFGESQLWFVFVN
jgi:hypothetical protein